MTSPKISEVDRLFLQTLAEYAALKTTRALQLAGDPEANEEAKVSLMDMLTVKQRLITLGSLLPTHA